ncbi:hypothetical protein GCM10007304_08000 [Rhodococcoides trifolii]|uniref:Sigma-K anti-sigma factor RskA n=1 Tax=Rhodococcoides trifolii TaxID=908250 RepID=A0A917FRF1_9NOCA|nr:hypothetical protein [Rhodococcus trifolii]GGF96443.1 hypothetical protein GCM10007304_08000 [Rhodococcus trifolii]
MSNTDDRRAELIAAAVGDDLDDAELHELRALAAVDPTVDDEIEQLRDVVGRVSSLPTWIEPPADGSMRRQVVGRRTGRRLPVIAAAAAVGILAGVAGVLGIQAVRNAPVTGPPGTLGAYEQVDFDESEAGLTVDGGLVAHTWGTETVLEVSGVRTDEVYGVYLREASGLTMASGTFLGTPVPVDCRMNAAVGRSEVIGLEIRTARGDVVATAEVPQVS